MSPAEFPVFLGQPGRSSAAPGPIPDDLRVRQALQRELVPAHLLLGAVIDSVPAPIVPTAAVLDSLAETFSLAGGGTLKFVVDEYEGVNPSAGALATLRSAAQPAQSLLAANDQIGVRIAGEAKQDIEIGALGTGALIAAQIQTLVRALTAATVSNQAAYNAFTCVYTPVTTAKVLAVAIPNATVITEVFLTNVQSLRRGQSLTIQGATDQVIKIIDIDWNLKKLTVQRFTSVAVYAISSVVDSADDRYLMTAGKPGSDVTVAVVDATAENAADLLKMRAGDGATGLAGTDSLGEQKVPYVDADFAAPAAATAAELVLLANKFLTGVIASVSAAKLRLTSRKLGAGAFIRALPGDSITKLGYLAVEQTGVETDVELSLDSPLLTAIVPYTIATGVLGAALIGADITTKVGQRRKNLENISGGDLSAGSTLGWLVVSKPAP